MTEADPSKQVVLQRIRNRVIEALELFASLDDQRDYARTVPIYVPYELINGWEDWVDRRRPSHFVDPVFTRQELDAIEAFHLEWEIAANALPDDYPPLEQVLSSPYWVRLSDAALIALATFQVRGRLSEDAECAPTS